MRRPLVILIAVTLCCLAALWIMGERRDAFDDRYENAERRIQKMAQSIDEDIENTQEDPPAGE